MNLPERTMAQRIAEAASSVSATTPLARADDGAAQRDEPAADVEVEAQVRAARDGLAARHEDGPVAWIEDLDPLGMAG